MATTTADEFMDATLDVWELAPESATRVGHPAPFPVELPQRLIDLYTYEGDVVLDPFMGSGTTAVAAVRTGRHYLGYDTDEAYVKAARERADAEVARVQANPGPARPDKAAAAAGDALAAAGFTLADPKATKRRRFAGGISVDWIATDARGRRVARARGRRQHRDAHRLPPLRRAVPHARRGGRAHHRRPPGARAHHRPPGPRLGRRSPRWPPPAGVTLVDALELGATGVAPRLAAYAAGGQHDPVGELLPGL